MKEWKNDVSVYLNFFNRPETFVRVFNAVKEARPSRLFLSCDGPRENNPKDIENVQKCKAIAEEIDWDCKVYKNYSDHNLGCGMRMYSGISWAFQTVDRLIILEDDCIPNQDFFPFCQELLEKYKDDNRIFMINAMNHLGKYLESSSSYFFGQGCCWGWATWKRAWDQVDFLLDFLEDEYSMKCVELKYPYYRDAILTGTKKKRILQRTGRLSSWTYQAGMGAALNSQLAIVPSVNLITNIGLTEDSTHSVNSIKKLDRKTQRYFNQAAYPLSFPLQHPKFVVEDLMYYYKVRKKFNPTIIDKAERCFRLLIYSNRSDMIVIGKKALRKIRHLE